MLWVINLKLGIFFNILYELYFVFIHELVIEEEKFYLFSKHRLVFHDAFISFFFFAPCCCVEYGKVTTTKMVLNVAKIYERIRGKLYKRKAFNTNNKNSCLSFLLRRYFVLFIYNLIKSDSHLGNFYRLEIKFVLYGSLCFLLFFAMLKAMK